MKIKILPILVVISLVFTGINVIATEDTDNDKIIKIVEIEESISFSQATIESKGEYVSVNIAEANALLRDTGKPKLPIYTKTFRFPEGTKIKNVECTLSDIKSEVIDGKIEPVPQPLRKVSIETTINQVENEEKIVEDQSVYSSSELFPNSWYSYKIGHGLDRDRDVIFLKVECYPVRYSPAENTYYYTNNIDIHIIYEEATDQGTLDSKYELLIITPRRFKLALAPLLLHKTKIGVSTKIKTTQSIYRVYEGRDKPEQIKNFIKYAKDTWDIKYLLLVGGLKSHIYANDRDDTNQGSKAWHLPVRYANNDYERYISDLYYADLDDWDSNSNDIFADYDDDLDLYPDVFYGRLACRNLFEVCIAVKKIIKYESSYHMEEAWFKRMIAAGGVTFEEDYQGQPDGEWLCNVSLENMSNIIDDPVRIFASDFSGAPRPVPKDIIEQFSRGAGFVLFQGHGNAFVWDTHWPNDNDPGKNWTGGLMTYQFPQITNNGKLPIMVVGGCHNGIYSVSLVKTLLDQGEPSNYHAYGMPTAWCFSWRMVAKPDGGAITCTGCTGYGLGSDYNPLSLSAELENNFFYEIGQNGATTVGEAHSGAIQKYIDENYIDLDDVYVILEYQLFGDPSLKIGGYPD